MFDILKFLKNNIKMSNLFVLIKLQLELNFTMAYRMLCLLVIVLGKLLVGELSFHSQKIWETRSFFNNDLQYQLGGKVISLGDFLPIGIAGHC